MISTPRSSPYLRFQPDNEQYFSLHVPAISCLEQKVHSEKSFTSFHLLSKRPPFTNSNLSSLVPGSAVLVSILFLLDHMSEPQIQPQQEKIK